MKKLNLVVIQNKENQVTIPPPRVNFLKFHKVKERCPQCRKVSGRVDKKTRRAHDLGNLTKDESVEIVVEYSYFYCKKCNQYFPHHEVEKILPMNGQYTLVVKEVALEYITEQGLPLRETCWCMWRYHRVFVPFGTLHNWVKEAGKKIRP